MCPPPTMSRTDYSLAEFEAMKAKWDAVLALQQEKVTRAREACENQRIRLNAMVDDADSELSKQMYKPGVYKSKFQKIGKV